MKLKDNPQEQSNISDATFSVGNAIALNQIPKTIKAILKADPSFLNIIKSGIER